MANTKSAKKAARQIARRTVINKSRRSHVRSAMRKIEEALAAGDRSRALAAMAEAEPALIRAAQKGIVHRNAARRKVSRLAQRIAKLEQKIIFCGFAAEVFEFAGNPIVDCHEVVALLSRQIAKIALAGVCLAAKGPFLFAQAASIGGYPKKLSRRIHGP